MLRQLTGQARTRVELERILARKGIPEDAARAVLDRLGEVGLVDDQAFAQAWVESRQQRRHLSRSALKRELARKGVEPEVITDAVAGVDSDDELGAARALAEKKSRSMGGLDPEVRRRRLAGALARRGFGPGIVYRVLDEMAGGLDESAVEDAMRTGDG